MQVPNGTGPGVRRSKRPLLASRTRCNVLWKPPKFGNKVKIGNKVQFGTRFAVISKLLNEYKVGKLLNEYKVGKAYSYFTSGWLKEVFYHHINSTSPYCLLRAACTPSMKAADVDQFMTLIPSLTLTELRVVFPGTICNGCCMSTGNAYHFGYLVPSLYLELAYAPIVEIVFLISPCLFFTFHLDVVCYLCNWPP